MDGHLALRGLSLRYPTSARGGAALTVFEDLALEARPGELLSVIGPSGCGKTTLLHLLMGLLAPSAGEVVADRRQMALVFQRPRLLPWRRVLQNTTFGAECRGIPPDDARQRATKLLERIGLGDHLGDYPHQLSEGMQQRVNLARALLVDPRVLLLDEPFAALDVMARRALQDDLLALWKDRGFTTVFVSHSLEEVAYLADRVVVLSAKPTRILEITEVDLPRPRATTPETTLELLRLVERLEAIMRGL